MDIRRGAFRLFVAGAALWTAYGAMNVLNEPSWQPEQLITWGPEIGAPWHAPARAAARSADECRFQARIHQRNAELCPPMVQLSASQVLTLRVTSLWENLPMLLLLWLLPLAVIYLVGRTIWWIANGFRGA